ncbi:MAG: universal stress protein A [Candidatus Azotimanducaceae bacterium]|jgi:universal stress protein A
MSKRYKKVLLAVDYHEDNMEVIATASELQQLYDAELHIVHVNEPLSVAYAADGVTWGSQVYELDTIIRKENEKKMEELKAALSLSDDQCHQVEGRPSTRIHEICEEGDFDLIVLGTHGQHGLQLLLGSTANAVLHGSPCDVLSVRLRS